MSNTTDSASPPALAPDFLFPLQKRTRSDAVTAQLLEMGRLGRSAVLRRARDTDPERRLERETLVALTRGYLRAADRTAADAVLDALIQRVSGAVAGKISLWARLSSEDKIDAQRQMFAQICEQVSVLGPSAEFWECNFTFCFNTRLITLWHRLTDRQVATVPAEVKGRDGEALDRVEQHADPADGFADLELQDLVALVSSGDAKRGQAIFLRLSGFSEEEIAARLGVTSRTLRNWTAEARAAWNRRAE